ncbi:MAG: hypothetical protein HUU35_03840, partial [Armatimonadetes bacterium]|nr:hypothetical protein [Armatimonadota bacterium]
LSLGAVTVTSGRGGGYQLGYSLTRAADLTLLVRSLSGRTLRHVTHSAAAAGRGELFWDGRGPDGRPVPNGVYQLELVATASDGATVRVLRTLRVVR